MKSSDVPEQNPAYWTPDLDHNVYILGAGFSFDGGMPLVNNFLERMAESVDWLLEQGRVDEARAIGNVFEFRLRAAGAAYRSTLNVENIEELFSLASAAKQTSEFSQDITTAIAATLEFCRATSYAYTCNVEFRRRGGATPRASRSSVPLYQMYADVISGKLCDDPNRTRNTIITFNYDTLLERGLHASGTPFSYGVGIAYQPTALSDESAITLPVFKLHGSVNWGTQPESDETIRVFGEYGDVLRNQERVLLLPPTWRKTFGGGLTDIWASAVKSLKTATRIIVLGFSMSPTDSHFKYLLIAGLQNNISLRKLLFVNPGLDGSKHPVENKMLRENLFGILRPELQERGTVELVPANTMDFLLGNEWRQKIGRNCSGAKMVVNVIGPTCFELQ